MHCCKNIPAFTRIPVYATIPVISLGRTLLQDLYASTPLAASIISTESLNESAYAYPSAFPGGSNPNILLQAPTHEEIANYFGLVNPLCGERLVLLCARIAVSHNQISARPYPMFLRAVRQFGTLWR